ncbi:MAG: hypothetical protein JO157_16630 [Acetobacteraceae bacterium]|nr:hypothetical protein [Acetobacteraceae bacterium]
MPDNSPFLSLTSFSGTAGAQATFNYGRQIWCCWYQNGADMGSRTAFQVPLSGSTNLSLTAAAAQASASVDSPNLILHILPHRRSSDVRTVATSCGDTSGIFVAVCSMTQPHNL